MWCWCGQKRYEDSSVHLFRCDSLFRRDSLCIEFPCWQWFILVLAHKFRSRGVSLLIFHHRFVGTWSLLLAQYVLLNWTGTISCNCWDPLNVWYIPWGDSANFGTLPFRGNCVNTRDSPTSMSGRAQNVPVATWPHRNRLECWSVRSTVAAATNSSTRGDNLMLRRFWWRLRWYSCALNVPIIQYTHTHMHIVGAVTELVLIYSFKQSEMNQFNLFSMRHNFIRMKFYCRMTLQK